LARRFASSSWLSFNGGNVQRLAAAKATAKKPKMQRWNQVQLLAEADPPSRTGAAVVTHFLVFSTWLAENSPTPAAVRAATRSSYSASCFRPETVYDLLGAAIMTTKKFKSVSEIF
jgi:hypothetical protein